MATWWVAQEGALGDIVNGLSNTTSGASDDVTWHVVEGSSNKPNSTARGPYKTKAAAQAEADTLNGNGPGSDHPSVLKQAAESAAGAFVPGAGGLIAAVTAFLKDLADVSTWRSLGWMALGAFLLIIGIAMWVGEIEAPNIEAALGTVAGAAVKAP
jgi:hypothetical protein